MQNYCKAFANEVFEFAFALQFLKGKKKRIALWSYKNQGYCKMFI